MYQQLPDNAYELVLSHNEQILYVFNLRGMRDMLSGDEKAQPFCFITTERVYFYRFEKDGEIFSDLCDVDSVSGAEFTATKQPKELLHTLFAIPAALLCALCIHLSLTTGLAITNALFIVFMGVWAVIFAVLTVYILIKALSNYNKKQHAVMHVTKKSGGTFTFETPSLDTNEMKNFQSELKKARAARRAQNPELFVFG